MTPTTTVTAFDPAADQRLLTVADLAHCCQVSRKFVYRAIERGELSHSRLGGAIRITPQAAAAWLASKAIMPPGHSAGQPSTAPRIRRRNDNDGLTLPSERS